MASELSPQSESYLQNLVTGGFFPTKEAAIEAAVAALREKNEQPPLIPEEHSDRVEQAIASCEAGLSRPLTADDWARWKQIAQDAADRAKRA